MALNTCQGLPGLGKRRFLARKGLERWKCAFGPVGSRFSPYLTALSGLFWWGLTLGEPGCTFLPLRATDWKCPDCGVPLL